ncbi:nucleoside-diphosphate sugar epimerase [Paenibacillus sp. GCM10023252]|uniref:nucleoside-diphosphate sugar epimerase n=1 Tax=Paenibacillus sp. GCM10023252 TaxID=3252649 RepID=UPI00361459F9
MQQLKDEIMVHMSHSHQQLARVLEAKRHVAVRMAQLVHALPDERPDFEGVDALIDNAHTVTKNVVAYLNSIADLQETMASQLAIIMREYEGAEEE